MSEHPVFDMGEPCSTPCSDAAGTCMESCPHLRTESLRQKKKRLKDAQKYERKQAYYEARATRRREHPEYYVPWYVRFRCFWTWPWGHVKERGCTDYTYICLACGCFVDHRPSSGY